MSYPSERPEHRYPHAAQLFGCYLHQDWPEDAGSWQAAADQFLATETAEQAQRAVADLDRLLADAADEATLWRALDAFGNAYDPAADGVPVRAWLAAVTTRLRADRHRNRAV